MAADPGQRRFPVEMSNASDGSRSLEFNVALLDGLWIVIGYSVVGVPQRESLSNSICEYLQLGIRAGQGTGKRVFFVFGWIWFIVPLSLPDRFKNWTIHHFSLNTKLVLTRLFWRVRVWLFWNGIADWLDRSSYQIVFPPNFQASQWSSKQTTGIMKIQVDL